MEMNDSDLNKKERKADKVFIDVISSWTDSKPEFLRDPC
jgi:hypothetical protein